MMWGRNGGRSLITGNSPAAWLIRILILLFLVGGVILILSLSSGARAEAPGAPVLSLKSLPDPLAAGWKGEKVCDVMQETAKLRMLKCTFPPGVGHERHFHAPHVGLILKGGTMRITDKTGTIERDLPTGGSWKSDGIDWHEAVNIGDTTAIYIITEDKAE